MSFEKGQSLVELVVAIGIFVIIASSLALLIFSSYDARRLAAEITQANFLAEEGLEATRSIRDNNWQGLTSGDYGLIISGGRWQFSGSSDITDGRFRRSVNIGDIGIDRKKITSRVTWPFTEVKSQEVILVTYLTNWQKGLEVKKPTAHTDSTGWTTPALSYNYPASPNDQLDSGSDTRMPDRDPAILFRNWAIKTETYTATVLKVNWRTNGLYPNDRFAIRYTRDGGTNWQDIVPLGVYNGTTTQTSSVNLDANQDLTLVQVKVVSDRVGTADNGTLYIYDIWTEGIF